MGMYTELIFGAKLAKYTPKVCIDALNHVINGNDEDVVSDEVKEFINKYSLEVLCYCSSYYFGVNKSVKEMWYDKITDSWSISIRSNLKNYHDEIETFLDYIKDYIESGSGEKELYAYVHYEGSDFPTMYTLDGVYNMPKVKEDK